MSEGTRLYAIGDVHGRSDLLEQLLDRLEAHLAARPVPRPILIFLGDYIDRGPDSRRVIDQLIRLKQRHEVVYLRGNHERCLMEFLRNPSILATWLRWGGLYTLRSYGLEPKNYLDSGEQEGLARSLELILRASGHFDFFDRLETSFTFGDFFFVHAGVRPGLPLDRQSETDLLEIRDVFLSSGSDFGKIVVHGHTPVPEPDIRANRINIDTGAFATGRLTCLVIERDVIDLIWSRP
ncbi:MAG TPA: metallophosphoesterase family protein [Xanthobacteraceae bacterium]|nr:metallophosphoesterase family protein [Xanthobacteraceae bacterium]